MNRTQDKNQILNDLYLEPRESSLWRRTDMTQDFYIGRSNKSNKSMNRTQDKNQIFN